MFTPRIEALRDKPTHRVFLTCTGGGAGIQETLWAVPGTSAFLAGAAFPYATEATNEFLGFKPEHYCSADIAVALAMESFYRAYEPGLLPPLGIGLTSSVTSMRAHRGDHRVFCASFSMTGCNVTSVILKKKDWSKDEAAALRVTDGKSCDLIGMGVLLEAMGQSTADVEHSLRHHHIAQSFEWSQPASSLGISQFFERPLFLANGTRGTCCDATTNGRVFLPGAFNPPHEGHFGAARAFEQHEGRRVTFMITADPPHKQVLTVAEMLMRAKLLRGYDRLFTKGDPLYIDKARKYPGASFIIGADALHRMLDPKWGTDPVLLCDEFRNLNTKFWVVDRMHEGELLSLDTIRDGNAKLPFGFPARRLPGRWDVSSSQIRAREA